jgi:integrase
MHELIARTMRSKANWRPTQRTHLLGAPGRVGRRGRPGAALMFPGDVPKLDDPLPRFIDDDRRPGRGSVRKALQEVAADAGLGSVTPHQLRQTLAARRSTAGCRWRRSPRYWSSARPSV